MENLKIPQNIPWPENVPVIRDRVVCMAEPHLAEGHHCQHWPAISLKGDQRWALIKVTTGGSEESSSSRLWSSLDTWSVQSREFRTGCRRRGQSRLDSPLPFEEVWMCVWSPSDPFLCGKTVHASVTGAYLKASTVSCIDGVACCREWMN